MVVPILFLTLAPSNITTMKFRVIIWHWENKLFDKEVEYKTQALADAFTMGLYHAFDSIGKKPTGMQTLPI